MTTIGAIRWDAWYNSSAGPGLQVARSLSTPEHSGRAPAYSTITGSTTVNFLPTQADFDAEITAAKNGGLDYWAYIRYGAVNPTMDIGWGLHQSSTIKNDMNWCLILQPFILGAPGSYSSQVAQIAAWMGQSNYQKVLGNRPLLYVYGGAIETDWGTPAAFKVGLDALRSACVSAGLGTPYIVIDREVAVMTATGSNARWDYSVVLEYDAVNDSPYATLASTCSDLWPSRVSEAKYVPTAMMGWDPRPRYKRPVNWDVNAQPYIGLSKRFITGTPAEIVGHIQDAVTFVAANPAACDANTVLVYAWDEYDEGGWLGPTLDGSGQARLAALGAALA